MSHVDLDRLLNSKLEAIGISRQIEDMALRLTQAVVLQGNELRGYMKIVSHKITPSDGAESAALDKWTLLMETLGLPTAMTLSNLAVQADIFDCEYDDFSFEWRSGITGEHVKNQDKELEISSYDPLKAYLVGMDRNVHIVGNGQNLPHGLLFSTNVFTLRPKLGVPSAKLRLTHQEPKYKIEIVGRTDLIVLKNSQSLLTRTNMLYGIEVKTATGMKHLEKSLREAVLQLLGVNVDNQYSSPPILLTNLDKVHYVVFISARSCEELHFDLNIRKYDSIAKALWDFEKNICNRICVTHYFGSPPTPPSSLACASDEYEEDSSEQS
jgi:hypothetical protein